MFQSAVKQLTVWYVGALFAVCLFFSVPTYLVTSQRLEHGAARQAEIIQELNGTFGDPFLARVQALREAQLSRDRHQLLRTIVIANAVILGLGAYLSYHFAKRTLKPIEEAHDAQTRFTTDASHELRTPLATMQAEIEVALRNRKFTVSQAKSILASNLEEIARLRTLSEELLNLARLDSDRLHKTSVDLSKLLEQEISRLEKRSHLTIQRTIEKGIQVRGDERLLRQLLDILADNAIKYAGDQPPRIGILLEKKDGQNRLAFSDYGIGITASDLPYIFDRFYRGMSASRHDSGGHGLGLSLAKQIVEAHDGAIHVVSQPGEQTTFEIAFPVA